MFAPIITPIACLNVINPALTSPTVKAVVPELDWINTVTNIPASTPISGFVVKRSRISRRRSPAACCSPSPMYLIPNKKIPNPPMNWKIIS